ncbi:TPA: hypothetical protein ACRNQ2_004105 [Pseudomonas aeruginosa]
MEQELKPCPYCRGYDLERRWCHVCNGRGVVDVKAQQRERAEFAWKSLLSTLGHAERLQALERLRLRIDAHMFIREDGELLGYGVTVPEMREFRELLIPFNGEIKIK